MRANITLNYSLKQIVSNLINLFYILTLCVTNGKHDKNVNLFFLSILI